MDDARGLERPQLLDAGFHRARAHFPDRPALWVAGRSYSYAELGALADRVAAALYATEGSGRFGAVLAHRSLSAFAGVLGVLRAGKGYVPLHPKFPVERTRRMMEASEVTTLVVGREALPVLEPLLAASPRPLTVLFPQAAGGQLARAYPRHRFLGPSELPREAPPATTPDAEATAYLMFTSGSTGMPKGVAVSHRNATRYMRSICELYGVEPGDRFSQTFDLTFDLSVHDMFVCWSRGACLYSIPQDELLAPARFIKQHRLSFWFSVPSLASHMSRFRLLKPGAFPSLRVSLFCGEALPAEIAAAWQSAAPDSVVENLYGPTEATIAILRYRWRPEISPRESVRGVVPIGQPFPEQHACLIDAAGVKVDSGEKGELCLAGSQVTAGYYRDPVKTRDRFITLPDGGDSTWYRTGDLARQRPDGCYLFLGRVDDQVKVQGHRVELQEVDGALQQAARTPLAACAPRWVTSGSCDILIGFLGDDGSETLPTDAEVIDDCRRLLPHYMVPSEIRRVPSLPLNVNGKIDRQALIQEVQGR